ncbi:MAG: hypothetical protein NUV84_02555, partial [Candidatus Uhrbacteria bacterium]|nr:hypothetical protein [Candidatus Uhrbacteria bacterium]
PYYKAIPVALARQETVLMWNGLVERRAAQDPTYPKDAELVRPFAHNLYGRRVLKFTPQGHPAYRGGLLGILKPKKYRVDPKKVDTEKDVRWIIGQLVGKTVKLGKGISLILPADGKYFEPHKLQIEEQWTGIEVKNVDGLWGTGTRITSHVVAAEQETIDVLTVLGLTLYSTSPFGVQAVVNGLLKSAVNDQNPIVVFLRRRGDVEVDTPNETVSQVMRSMGDMLIKGARAIIREARDRIVHELGSGGAQAHGLSDQDIFGGDMTPEKVREVHDNTEEDLLAAAIVTSKTAKDLGLEVWDGKCYVLVESRKALVLQRASSAGIQMAPPPSASPEPPKAESPPAVTQSEPTPAEPTKKGGNRPRRPSSRKAKPADGVTPPTTT